MKKVLALLVLTFMLLNLVACNPDAVKEGENIKNTEIVNDEEEMYQDYYENALLSKHGTFEKHQTGTMASMEDEWFNPRGIISKTIYDFDSDSEKEMLVFYTKKSEENNDYLIYADIYEVKNNIVDLSDTMQINAYKENSEYDSFAVALSASQWEDVLINVSLIEVNNCCYIICEKHIAATSFGDGQSQDYWIVRYSGEKLEYVSSFSQIGGGSMGFEYKGYEFEGGICKDSALYYSEMYDRYDSQNKPLFNHFGQAICSLFKKHNVVLTNDISNSSTIYEPYDFSNSILSEDNNMIRIFTFTNKTINADYSSYIFDFEAELSLHTDEASDESSTNNSQSTYEDIINEFKVKWESSGQKAYYREYAYHDVNEDGVDELIIHDGTCESDRTHYYYTIKNNEVVNLGSYNAWHTGLADGDGMLIAYDGMGGEGYYYYVTINNNSIEKTEAGTYTFPPTPDFGDEIGFFAF